MILIIDNYDSFTYNLYQQAAQQLLTGQRIEVFKNNEITIKQIERLKPSRIIISPGPGRPKDSGISMKVIKKFHKTIPILGVCLGHECIGQIFGSKIIKAKNIYHGKTSEIKHNQKGIFKNLKNP